MQVSRSDNSRAVQLPAAVVEVPGPKEGDDIRISVAGGVELAIGRSPGNREELQRLCQYRGVIPADFRFDRLEADGRRE